MESSCRGVIEMYSPGDVVRLSRAPGGARPWVEDGDGERLPKREGRGGKEGEGRKEVEHGERD